MQDAWCNAVFGYPHIETLLDARPPQNEASLVP